MRNPLRNIMHSVKMNRKELLNIVIDNRMKHVEEYKESIDGYKLAAVKIAAHNLKVAKSGDLEKFKTLSHMPKKPTSYEDNYVKAIRMLELSVEEVIEIDEHIFNQLVLDEWVWKHDFVATASMYKSVA